LGKEKEKRKKGRLNLVQGKWNVPKISILGYILTFEDLEYFDFLCDFPLVTHIQRTQKYQNTINFQMLKYIPEP